MSKPATLRRHIQNFAFVELFNELGWDNFSQKQSITVNGELYSLKGVAEKRGFVIFHCLELPDYATRRKIEKEVAKLHQENMLVYSDPAKSQQVYQWVLRTPGKPAANRQRIYHRGQSGEAIAQALQGVIFSLAEEDSLDLLKVTAKVKKGLDVEKITKRFYDRFKKEHDTFLKFIKGIPDEGFQRWYASVMLNRIMFIYFVQKKGFLDNDSDYLANKLNATQGNYYRDFLRSLFFQGFALRAEDRDANTNKLLGKIPYLNGGLFAPHTIEEQFGNTIAIDNRAFQQLFAFLDEYSWHLDERPLKLDNEINPDVLGYIFEKYINQKQMGAYYTKEDITGYITRNTVIPYLFDAAQRQDRIAFTGDNSIWQLAQATPDRYIYPAVKHGVDLPLPDEIACGVSDVAQRGKWNTPAPEDYGLPTEIWRETVARHQRYAEVHGKLAKGEVNTINDFITYNLNIEQFAQDGIENTDSPDLLRAFWKALTELTVLDPTVGSGAFLFAALNILESLYEVCLERMEAFISDSDRAGGSAQKFKDFRDVLKDVDAHPNRRYFILKRIMVNNLYGVDIMEEAVEICKLRLFLKLVAQIENASQIEPLPDIDFNIRAGNTLVGFATEEQLTNAISFEQSGQVRMIFGEQQETLDRIKLKAGDISRLFSLFKEMQISVGANPSDQDYAQTKNLLRQRLHELNDELNHLLSHQYDINPKKLEYKSWLSSHEPFHWFVEFYGVIQRGGFQVIIGNPPYVEYKDISHQYQVRDFATLRCGDLYAYSLERSQQLISKDGCMGFIVPISAFVTDGFISLQEYLIKRTSMMWVSSYANRPSQIFDGAQKRVTILLTRTVPHLGKTSDCIVHTTPYIRWKRDERENLVAKRITYVSSSSNYLVFNAALEKLGSELEVATFKKIVAKGHCLAEACSDISDHRVYYTRKFGYFLSFTDFVPKILNKLNGETQLPSELKILTLRTEMHKLQTIAALSSSIFFWFWNVLSDCRNLNRRELLAFPFHPDFLDSAIGAQLAELGKQYIDSLRATSKPMQKANLEIETFDYKSLKYILDSIDRSLAQHYGFTNEELDHIVNYDIKYRMGDDLQEEE